MRTAFVETLCQLAADNPRIWLLTGDLGFSVLERFASAFPDRYVNVGVAEQNMTGLAAGLAHCGKVVFTYSIANFPTLRCLEQIRNDVCYHCANVKIVAVGGGIAYGAAGYSHFALEDLAVMRSMPRMTVLAPGDPVEAALATRAMINWDGPCYLRLGKAGASVVHRQPPEFAVGRAFRLRDGDDVTFISTGALLPEVVGAADILAAQGAAAGVLSCPTVQPLDATSILAAAKRSRRMVVVEDHGPIGGLSDAVGRLLAEEHPTPLLCLTIDTAALLARGVVGSQAYLLHQHGLSAPQLADRVQGWLHTKH